MKCINSGLIFQAFTEVGGFYILSKYRGVSTRRAPNFHRVSGGAGVVLPDSFDAFHVHRVKSVFTVSLWM